MQHLMNELLSRSIVAERERELTRSVAWRLSARRVLTRSRQARPTHGSPGATALVAHP